MSEAPPVIVVTGPTASGKTTLGIQLALRIGGEIICADSMQVFRFMDIGTAKPSPEQLAQVPHHLIDIAEPEQSWSLAKFKLAADEAILGVQERNRLPLLVGGTGQYVTAILEGWAPPPKAADDSIRTRYEDFAAEQGISALHSQLKEVDPSSAARIDPQNVRRVARRHVTRGARLAAVMCLN